MDTIPPELQRRLQQHDQDHVLAFWGRLNLAQRRELCAELEQLDLDELQTLHARRHLKDAIPEFARLKPLPFPTETPAQLEHYRQLGEQAFRAGAVAFLVVAGGQGTRLGFDHPKGMYPIGPVSGKTLFELHAEKVRALEKRYGKPLPYLVMTSPATHDETVAFFGEHKRFGLDPERVSFFCQGTMPALDFDSGRLLLEDPGKLFLGPNGHGGTLAALHAHRLLDPLEQQGIHTLFYFQVDNPLTNLADLVFVGRHLAQRAEVSSKVLPKKHPREKMGNFVLVDGRCSIIEYSDLPDDWAHLKDQEGRLFFWGGNTAIHLFDVAFLHRISDHADSIPWHLARKKVPFVGADGAVVEPVKENALKFERFIFDVLPLAERWTVEATTRARDFEPLKNASGDDSPETVRCALVNQAAGWLEQAGVAVPRDAHGNVTVPVEISALVALDADDVKKHVRGDLRIEGPLYLGP